MSLSRIIVLGHHSVMTTTESGIFCQVSEPEQQREHFCIGLPTRVVALLHPRVAVVSWNLPSRETAASTMVIFREPRVSST